MVSIPIALCGKDPATCDGFLRGMLPEYDGKPIDAAVLNNILTQWIVVHVCHNAETAMSELPKLFVDSSIKPASGKGSNVGRDESKVPKVIVVGGGFTEAEFEEMRSFKILREVPWMYPPASTRARGKGPPPSKLVVAQVRKSLADNGMSSGRIGLIEPGVWPYGHEEVQPWVESGQISKL